MTNKSLWQKFKDVILYLFLTIVLLSLTSSFVVEDVYAVASRLSMDPEGIAEIYAINIGAKTNTPDEKAKTGEIVTEGGETIIVNEYALGDNNDEILEYARILYALEFLVNPPTTAFTDEMQTAVKTYQAMKNLETTGKFDQATIISLLAENIKFEKGSSSKLLKTYQDLLVKAQILAATEANGTFGDSTEAAVKAFQKLKGLPETGKIDMATLKALDSLRNQ